MSDSLQPHGLQHTKLPCPSLSPRVCSNSCPLSRWCHSAISFSVASFSSFCQSFPASGSFLMSWLVRIRRPEYWSFNFSISPCHEYSGLISFKIDGFDLLSVQGTLESSPAPQFQSIDSSVLNLLYGPALTSVYDYWKNHSFGYTDCQQQPDVSTFQYAV